ncbi:50S ribosomal protein L30 [Candidatus Woesearchaeota archaeon]|jgi:large subunit ribosomal protein L30e|nr:50S ribosomal protein L30 [Candidatus Woesearchaeota archaeon]MBT3537678.1 50S ribosomal protein L30 [Candidatus Woesearchaeota archaeon]MBT4697809.1 50S ribosomal protein L30 [Candidatus Woesearchaeota archaeon]MBT4716341.1 50S ribosomal protein L30 [Candidatus Woesearchaeota archaeon]MBT7105347.1 50S ribosomal protein L30 [Candidatus Woesearchaeota archaeon]
MSVTEEIKKLSREDGFFIGTDQTAKYLRVGKVKKVYVASNCKEETKVDLEHYAKLANVELIQLDENNEELGVLCKKPFRISVLGLK